MVEYQCLECGRPINHKGNCFACNIRLKKAGKGKNEKSWHNYFPHQPRFGQDKICDFVSKTIAEKKIGIVEAPYGIGKTASMLASGLASGKKIIFATCDHAIQDSLVKEVLNINEKLDKKLIVASIIGKEHMCLHLNYFNYEVCDFEKLHQKCPFFNSTYEKGRISKGTSKRTNELLAEIFDILKNNPRHLKNRNFTDFIVDKCTIAGLCPYEFMLELAFKADVVVLDYFHIFTPILSFMKKRVFQPENSILFIDEADRLRDRLFDILTRTISDSGLHKIETQIKNQMRKNKPKTLSDFESLPEKKEKSAKNKSLTHSEWLFYLRFRGAVEEFIAKECKKQTNGQEYENYIGISGKEFVNFLEDKLYDFDSIIGKISSIISKLAESESYKKVTRIDDFLKLWKNISEDFFTYLLLEDAKKSIVISPYEISSSPLIIEEDSEYFLTDILKSFYSCVLFSATIGNQDIFAESLGINDFAYFSSQEFNTQNYTVILKKDVSSVFRERQNNIPKIVNDMKFCKKIAGSALISFPSYNSLNSVLKHLDALPIQDITGDGVYYVVTGGKGSRGVNKAANINIVYIYGLQMAKPNDYLFNKRKDFALKKYPPEKALKLIYNDVVNKSCQIAGRIFRNAGKKGMVVLADRRYKSDFRLKNFFYECIPDYFKVKMIETSSQAQFEHAVLDFWQKKIINL